MKEDNGMSVKEFWKSHNVLNAVTIIGDSSAEIREKTMKEVWESFIPFLI